MDDGKKNGEAPDLSGIISALSQNPELLSMAARMFSGMAAPGGAETAEKPAEKPSESAPPPSTKTAPDLSSVLALLPALSGGLPGKGPKPTHDRRGALLAALKPYLSRERCEAIDYMMKFGQFGELLKNFEHK